ncbi:YitT family protein [Streptobacillus felis]|uniref:YitT family protein n=1 Tax=Streptobacillus felis TaxID=1384509 RepID=A0A7Z0PDN6_9FUSO|nr:YitT family protein [Streptobacillus felis]NYV27237.1 YitT family protein [Streptobacillus felis]
MFQKYKSYIIPTMLIIFSALVQSYTIQVFIVHSKLLTGGFTGLSILINMIMSELGIKLSVGTLLLILNFPVALLCAKEISKKFVFLSLLHIVMTSIFLKTFKFDPLFTNILLNLTIGAVVHGLQMVLALKVGGSTGGTDFIALYISNKINKSIWIYIFIFNMSIILIFGYMFTWDGAGYSIVFQFVTTKVIDTFYNRYRRITLQIFTKKADEVSKMYISKYRHGMTKILGEGAYLREDISVCYTVVSVYEVNDIVKAILKVDKNAIINTFKTEAFYGKFYIPPI